MLGSLDGKVRRSEKNAALEFNNRQIIGDKGKADAFMAGYAAASRIRLDARERSVKRDAKALLRSLGADSPSPNEFTLLELDRALRAMRAKGAAGEDGVTPQFLRGLGPVGRNVLLHLLNMSWTQGVCPQLWRNAQIVPLLKPGKPAGSVSSYRPVSLTSCVVKTLERMVSSRLANMAEENGWLSDHQAGFRRLRCCEDQVLRLSQDISDGFLQKKPLRTVLALLDFSKAFDTVWRDLLFIRLLRKGVPPPTL